MTPAAPASRRATTPSPATARSFSAMCWSPAWCRRSRWSPVPARAARRIRRRSRTSSSWSRAARNMFICGPEVIQAVTGQKCTMEEIGSAMANASVSGNVHFIAENDADAVRIVKKLLSYLPSNNVMDPPHTPTPQLDLSPDPEMNELVPDNIKDPLDVHEGHRAGSSTTGDYLEVMKEWAKNIVDLLRPHPGHRGRHHRQSARGQGRHARHRRLGQGRAVHPVLQRLQHPDRHPGGRPRLHARRASRSAAASSATAPRCSSPTPRPPCRRSPSSCARPTAAPTWPCAAADMGADAVYAWPTRRDRGHGRRWRGKDPLQARNRRRGGSQERGSPARRGVPRRSSARPTRPRRRR